MGGDDSSMNWTAVGAVGELVGGVVVVVTLIYLAAQIRQNTRATRAHATASLASEMERNLLAVAENGALAEVFVKASQGVDLSPAEGVRLLFWWGSYVRNIESHFLQADLGSMSEDILLPVALTIRQFSQIPIFENSLREMIEREIQSKVFRDWVVENILS